MSEANDALILAVVPPMMPASLVAKSDKLWNRIVTSLPEYQRQRYKRGKAYPLRDPETPFTFRHALHEHFLTHDVVSYRVADTFLSEELFHAWADEGYFSGNIKFIDVDGTARGKPFESNLRQAANFVISRPSKLHPPSRYHIQ